MKRILVGAVFLFSISAFACPDLNGTYICKSSDGYSQNETTISQGNDEVGPFIIIGDGANKTYLNGQEHDLGGGFKYKTQCTDYSIKINISGAGMSHQLSLKKTDQGYVYTESARGIVAEEENCILM